MLIDYKTLKKIKVETKSGIFLGHVNGLVLETEGQMVFQYLVASSMIRSKNYLINRNQVLVINKEKIIVDDSVEEIDEKKKKSVVEKNIITNPGAAMMNQILKN